MSKVRPLVLSITLDCTAYPYHPARLKSGTWYAGMHRVPRTTRPGASKNQDNHKKKQKDIEKNMKTLKKKQKNIKKIKKTLYSTRKISKKSKKTLKKQKQWKNPENH